MFLYSSDMSNFLFDLQIAEIAYTTDSLMFKTCIQVKQINLKFKAIVCDSKRNIPVLSLWKLNK